MLEIEARSRACHQISGYMLMGCVIFKKRLPEKLLEHDVPTTL